ncbi:MAG: ATP-binding protein [Desulfonatronovibrionaceae bacterium]
MPNSNGDQSKHELQARIAKLEEELDKTRRTAEEANRAKSNFLAVMSHELRTPLNAIIGFTDLLLETPLDKKQEEYARIITESGRKLWAQIGDLLELSRIESGEEEVKTAPVQIRQLLETDLRFLGSLAREKGLKFVYHISETVPRTILSDSSALRQILLNLVKNAIKYTEEGGIQVNADIEAKTDDQNTLILQVQDTGIGIETADLEKIFSPFSQADSSFTRQFSGTGLGLTISRNLARCLNGDIQVQSAPDTGSTFTLFIPLIVAQPEEEDQNQALLRREPLSFAGQSPVLRVLVAEDDPLNRKLISTFLKSLGHEFEMVENGREAVRSAGEKDYDIILMDLHMPVMGGMEAAQEIYASENSPASPVIIAMTADARKDIVRECLESGIADYLTKPFEKAELKRVLKKWKDRRDCGRD